LKDVFNIYVWIVTVQLLLLFAERHTTYGNFVFIVAINESSAGLTEGCRRGVLILIEITH
jgi:hypothetical protein